MLSRKICAALFLLLIGDCCNYHFACESWERSRHVDIRFGTDTVWVKKTIRLSELSDALLGLQKFETRLIHVLESVNFIDAEDDRDGGSIDAYNLVDFLFPLSRVLNWLNAWDIGDHYHSLSFSAKTFIEAFVTGVHTHKVPNFQAHLVALHLKQLELVIWPDCCLVVCRVAIANEPIDKRSFPDGWVS